MRYALPLLALFQAALVQPAGATIPIPEPEPARLAAARLFVDSLPFQENLNRFSASQMRNRVIGSVIAAAASPPGSAEIASIAAARVDHRIDEVLPEILPSAKEEIARSFALFFTVDELNAATAFYRSAQGWKFALRSVWQDAQLADIFYRRLLERIAPEADRLIADAAAAERLRHEVNADPRR